MMLITVLRTDTVLERAKAALLEVSAVLRKVRHALVLEIGRDVGVVATDEYVRHAP